MERRTPQGVDRRMFLSLAAAGAAWASHAQAVTPPKPDTDTPPAAKKAAYSHWMHGFGGDDPKATAAAMKEMGFDVVVAGGDKVIEAVREAGMRSWLCGGAFGIGEAEDAHKALDFTGKPQMWFGSGSPNDPEVRAKNLKSYEDMAKTPGVEGILVDGCRFASPASGVMAFLTDFSDHSAKKAAELGFDFDVMRKDVEALHGLLTGLGAGEQRGAVWLATPAGAVEWLLAHPGVFSWLRFRAVCITEHFKNIADVLHAAGVKMGVYIFAPSFAPLVGQSYTDLAEFVDVFAPMLYRNYAERPGIACLNWELTIIPEELNLAGTTSERDAMNLYLSWMGLEHAIFSRNIAEIQKAVPPEVVGNQTALARARIGDAKELVPIIHIDDPEIAKTAQLVRDRAADGVNFFVYADKWADMVRPAFKK